MKKNIFYFRNGFVSFVAKWKIYSAVPRYIKINANDNCIQDLQTQNYSDVLQSIREPVKKNSTLGGGLDQVIFHTLKK